ncbi:hypothetical protein LUZ61_008057 [Rhynchospora tenuis]|uniref:F-box domain-containing protein n=1 Tax=Rhynchospora tenuis TaxID=198213 RepID=A0AAD6EX36_9POAL|nr:hypothetical protein LUZ61_008057 [Rhynchospora tenuis]
MAEVDDDRISALPEEIKVSILSLLSITDAVRTSVLSSSWRHLWTLLPGLHAGHKLVHDLNLFPEGLLRGLDSEVAKSRWRRTVQRLLSSLPGPIHYITLASPFRDDPALPTFLDLIYQKGAALEKLNLESMIARTWLQLPYFRSLKQLRLYCVRLCLPADFQGFHQLTDLKLHTVHISRRDIMLLVNQSKKLTFFESYYALHPDPDDDNSLPVTFNCPLLKTVEFLFCEFCKEGMISSAPCLERASFFASLDGLGSLAEELASLAAPTMKFLAHVAHVSHLSFCFRVLKCLSLVDVPHALHFHQLRCLELDEELCHFDIRMYGMFCCLLKRMPCLELLKIKCDLPEEYDELVYPIPVNEYMKKQDGFRCLDRTLKTVAVYTFDLTYINTIMWMVHFILLNANVLECFEITFEESDPQVISSIFEELCEAEKASLDAKVVLQLQE